jgi:hypothetical protein
MAHYEATFPCAFTYMIRLCHCWQTFRRLVTFCITANFVSGIATMANWNILSEALSVLEGRCDKVTGTAYPCCSCLRILVPVLHYISYTKLVIRLTSAFLSATCHLEINFSFSAYRYYRYIFVTLPRVHLRLLSGAN